MGVYDTVRFVGFCPRCGARLKDFQTKDYESAMMDKPTVECDNWYASCPECGLWVEFGHLANKWPQHKNGVVHIKVTYAK